MPRIRYHLSPAGLVLNFPEVNAPQGSLLEARGLGPLVGGAWRSMPPTVGFTLPTLSRFNSGVVFNNRRILYGSPSIGSPPTPTPGFDIETGQGTNAFVSFVPPLPNLTAFPATTFTVSAMPMLFLTAPPTPDRDEYVFALNPAQGLNDNALVKISNGNAITHWGILPLKPSDLNGITTTKLAQQSVTIGPSSVDAFSSGNADGASIDAAPNTEGWVIASGDDTPLKAGSFAVSQVAPSSPAAPGSDGRSIKIKAAVDDAIQISRVFATPIDLTVFPVGNSSNADFIQFWVRVRRPRHIESLEIAFDTSDGSFTTTFSAEVNFQLVQPGKQRRQLVSVGDLVPDKKQQQFLKDFGQGGKALDLSVAAQNQKTRVFVAKNAWARVTIPKSLFHGDGVPNWATVKGVRVTLTSNKEGNAAVWIDNLQLVGGAGMYGDYQYTFTLSNDDGTPASPGSRSNPPIDDKNGSVTGVPYGLATVQVSGVERQAVRLTFNAGLTFDKQVSRIEVWRTVGNGATFFRCGYIPVTVGNGSLPAGFTYVDSAADYYGLNENAILNGQASPGTTNFAVLDPSEVLPIDNTSPLDLGFCFTRMAEQLHLGRVWWGCNIASVDESNSTRFGALGGYGAVYYSPPNRREVVQGSVQVTSGASNPVQALVVFNDRLFVLSTAALYEIVGSDEPFVAQKVEGVPGTAFPFTVKATPIGIMWLGPDGVYLYDGASARNITDPVLMPIFRHRINTFGLTLQPNANCRAVAGRSTYYLAPDFTQFTMAFDFESGTWRYFASGMFQSGNNAGAAFFDPLNQRILVNSSGGGLAELEPLTYPTAGISDFLVIRPGPYFHAGPGRQGILRRIYVQTALGPNGSTSVTQQIFPNIDGADQGGITLAPVPSQGGTRSYEVVVNKPGNFFGCEFIGTAPRDLRVHYIELDIYVPGEFTQPSSDQQLGYARIFE